MQYQRRKSIISSSFPNCLRSQERKERQKNEKIYLKRKRSLYIYFLRLWICFTLYIYIFPSEFFLYWEFSWWSYHHYNQRITTAICFVTQLIPFFAFPHDNFIIIIINTIFEQKYTTKKKERKINDKKIIIWIRILISFDNDRPKPSTSLSLSAGI